MPSIIEEQVAELEKQTFILGKENEMQGKVFVKFEETLEKLQDLTESMHRLLSLHDERIKVNAQVMERIKEEMNNDIRELENRLSKETEALSKKIDDSETRILSKIGELQKSWKEEKSKSEISDTTMKIFKYKYFIMGAAIVAGFFLHQTGIIGTLINFLKIVP
jgi:chromosome segregation ATPase